MDIEIRPEREGDFRAVEELTREAFWNVHVPGCDEHLLVHTMRKDPAFIPELDFVAFDTGSMPAMDDRVVGNIMYCRSTVKDEKCNVFDTVTFGPLSVLPECQGRGIGGRLVRHSLKAAAGMGFPAVLIYGDPAYYSRFGFESAKEFGISTSEGKFVDALMALELYPGALNKVSGRFLEGDVYKVDQEALIEFDGTFPHKEKFVTESQKRFLELSSQ